MTGNQTFDSASTELEKRVTLLEASAGTGKTYALARIFLRLVAEEGVETGKILTVTFTTAATEELRDRIRGLLVEAYETLTEPPKLKEEAVFERLRNLKNVPVEECIRRIRLAITCIEEAIISTIHGFCNRVLSENSFETQSLFDTELNKASKDMVKEGVDEYWRDRFASANPVVSAAASTTKIKPADMVDFFDSLPRTQDYELGFREESDFQNLLEQLLQGFEKLKLAWAAGQGDYSDYVSTCLSRKNARANTQLARHVRILNQCLNQGEISPAGFEILDDMRASRLTAKKEFRERDVPSFAREAESFCLILESFGRAVRVDCVRYLEEKMSLWKAKRGVVFFDDLLSLTAHAVNSESEDGQSLRVCLRDSFDAVLIDEFQDTDPVQFEIFSRLFGQKNEHWLFLIGDPKQSIYRFRGADLEAYFEFAQKTNAQKYSLDTNFRTVTPLVESVNAFFEKSDKPFLHKELSFVPVNPNRKGPADRDKLFMDGNHAAFVIRELDWRKDKEPSVEVAREAIRMDMANEIEYLLSEGTIGGNKVRPKDIAVLVRSNPDARKVWQSFRKRGLPAVVFTDVSLFDSPEAKEILWVLEGMVNARNERAIKRALATGLLGMTSGDFQLWQDKPEKWDEWIGIFRECLENWRKKGVYVALHQLFRVTHAIPKNLCRPDGERRVTNFLHLAEVLHRATSNHPLSPSSLLVWLRARIEQNDSSDEEYQLRLESQSESIRILTVHKSKGLEYPIVFLPGLSFPSGGYRDDFKYHREDGKLVVDLEKTASDDAKARGVIEEEQEDARVLYVALTRSASRCYLYHAPVKISSNARVPAQVRMMRSWATDGNTAGTERNSLAKQASAWVDTLGGRAEYNRFTTHQSEIIDFEKDETNRTESVDLQTESWDENRHIPDAKIVESFSGLSKQVGFDGRDLDGTDDGQWQQEDIIAEENQPIFKFPAGAHAGNFMHDVFEHLNFSDSSGWKEFISKKLVDHQFDSKQWTPVILDMVHQVMGSELEQGFCLNLLNDTDRLEEMEFYFPVSSGFLPELAQHLPAHSKLKKYLDRISADECMRIDGDGYLKGLIDLTFRRDGRYYILDWKSNKLSGSSKGFDDKEVEREMLTHHYVLQYHIYTVALHRFLQSRMKEYSYERNFGGVYYLFVRGLRKGSDRGVFYDLPDLETVQTLEKFLISDQ
jgi:exodeoxyribonuclease V beta subunit